MRQRVQWIDAAKGIGILLVLLGHAPRDIMRADYTWIDFCYYFIYTFHMHFSFCPAMCLPCPLTDGDSRVFWCS